MTLGVGRGTVRGRLSKAMGSAESLSPLSGDHQYQKGWLDGVIPKTTPLRQAELMELWAALQPVPGTSASPSLGRDHALSDQAGHTPCQLSELVLISFKVS